LLPVAPKGEGWCSCSLVRKFPDAVAGLLDRRHQIGQAHQRRIVDNARLLGGEVDTRLVDTLDLAEPPLDAPDA
jgi:hypothetical protein